VLRVARLILLNGPPGIGKSTLAGRYISDHPLSLVVDIDSIRMTIGGWENHRDSMALARRLAVAMADTHLRAGHDVVIPQMNQWPETIEVLGAPAAATGAELHEIMLLAIDDLLGRVTARQAELEAGDVTHPIRATEFHHASLASIVDRLQALAAARPQTEVIYTTAGAIDDAYHAFCAAVR
jgi:predicted kinase